MSERRSEAGYTLVVLMATVTIMLITMGLGVPYWRYVIRDDKEQELLFRGEQIANGIACYQSRHANAPPPSLEVLVEMKCLRKLYEDPMTESGEWRLIRPGEALGGPVRPPGEGPGTEGRPTPTPDPRKRRPQPSQAVALRQQRGQVGQPGAGGGGILGVASRSEESSLRVVNGRERYDEWLFIANQPIVVGGQPQAPGAPAATLPGGTRQTQPPSTLRGGRPGQTAPPTLPGPTRPPRRPRSDRR